MSVLDNASVKRVRDALVADGVEDSVRVVAASARTAKNAAQALDTELGAIVKSLVFVIGEQPVLVLVSGDRKCEAKALPRVFGLEGAVRRCDADEVRAATGFAIGGVAPVGLSLDLPCAIDVGLKRFDTVWAAGGHPRCVFPTTVAVLKRLTGGIVSYALTKAGGDTAMRAHPNMRRLTAKRSAG